METCLPRLSHTAHLRRTQPERRSKANQRYGLIRDPTDPPSHCCESYDLQLLLLYIYEDGSVGEPSGLTCEILSQMGFALFPQVSRMDLRFTTFAHVRSTLNNSFKVVNTFSSMSLPGSVLLAWHGNGKVRWAGVFFFLITLLKRGDFTYIKPKF